MSAARRELKAVGPGPVLLYDGECGLCQRVVKLMLRLDRRGRLRFGPLQGVSAQRFLRANGLPAEDFDSLVYVPEWPMEADAGPVEHRLRTEGGIGALRELGGIGRVLAWTAVVPAGWRDELYRIVARTRQRWFGPAVSWSELTAAQRARFLDGPEL